MSALRPKRVDEAAVGERRSESRCDAAGDEHAADRKHRKRVIAGDGAEDRREQPQRVHGLGLAVREPSGHCRSALVAHVVGHAAAAATSKAIQTCEPRSGEHMLGGHAPERWTQITEQRHLLVIGRCERDVAALAGDDARSVAAAKQVRDAETRSRADEQTPIFGASARPVRRSALAA